MPRPPISSHTHTISRHNKITRQNQYQIKQDKAYQQLTKFAPYSEKSLAAIDIGAPSNAKHSSTSAVGVAKFLLFLNAANAVTLCATAESTPTKKPSPHHLHNTRSNSNVPSSSETSETITAEARAVKLNKQNEHASYCVTEEKKERYTKHGERYTYIYRCTGIMTEKGLCKPTKCNIDPNTILQNSLTPPPPQPPVSSQHAIIGAGTTLIGLGIFAYTLRNRVRQEADRVLNRHLNTAG